MKSEVKLLLTAITLALSANAVAAISAEEAAKLGGPELTVWGAEKAGNKDGSIPAWTGERIKVPASYDPKDPRQLPTPWDDKPLFSITAQNMDKYADRLTEGQKAMLKKYPTFRMDIYPTRRTANYPKYVLDNTLKNATACKTVDNQLALSGCYGGFPFPIPKTGNEVIWNHVARFTLHSWSILSTAWMVPTSGPAINQGTIDSHQVSPFYDPKVKGPADPKVMYWKLRFDYLGPSRKVGEKYIILDALDAVNVGRRAYAYIPGQRRVKLAPDLAYDTPSPVSGGAGTMDQVQVFLGAQDRYDFKLVGKQEKYIMYNNYALTSYKDCPNEKILTKNHYNPDCIRYELHRVWVVEATVKPGYRHILPRRTLYFDEDTLGAGTSSDYDSSSKLYRVVDAPYHHIYTLNGYGNVADNTAVFDLQTGLYYSSALMSQPGHGLGEESPKPDSFFSPEALAGEGIR